MNKYFYFTAFLCLTLCYGCKQAKYYNKHEMSAAIDEDSSINDIESTENAQSSQDSLAIGDIYLGIDEYTFNERKKAFLENNPSLNGRLVEEMNGDFYKGKLYSVTIRSVEIEDESLEPIVQNDNELKQKWEKESHIWTSLYKEKYKRAKQAQIDGIEYIVINKGRCTIEVSDKEHKLPSLEELEEINKELSRGKKVPLKICSVIHIYDKTIIEQIRKEKEENNKQKTMKSLDVI